MTTAWTGRWDGYREGVVFPEAFRTRKETQDDLLDGWFEPEEYADKKGRARCLATMRRKGLRAVKVRLVPISQETQDNEHE